jgi:hypothetical protein
MNRKRRIRRPLETRLIWRIEEDENPTSEIVTGQYTLQLKDSNGAVVNEVTVQQGSPGWSVELPAGHYTLTEASHSQWVCNITIQ